MKNFTVNKIFNYLLDLLKFIKSIFPKEYNVEAHHVINTVFGLFSTCYTKLLKTFNKNIGKISCVFLFLTPTFWTFSY